MRNYLSGTDIKEAELRMLDAFSSYCFEQGLTFTLITGTLLGAVRHEGFIPWDDDIDLGMPRPDYNRIACLAADFQAKTGYRLRGVRDSDPTIAPLLKVEDPAIMVQEKGVSKCAYLWLDIMPFDALPSDDYDFRRLLKSAKFYLRAVYALSTDFSKDGHVFADCMRLVTYPLRRTGRALNHFLKKLNELGKARPFSTAGYVGVITWGRYGAKERFSGSGLDSLDSKLFEGRRLPVLGCWDDYLKNLYGDYMQLPPISERHTHGIRAWFV